MFNSMGFPSFLSFLSLFFNVEKCLVVVITFVIAVFTFYEV